MKRYIITLLTCFGCLLATALETPFFNYEINCSNPLPTDSTTVITVVDTNANGSICQTDTCESTSATVYVCTGPQSVCYHSSSKCRGLSRCSADVKAVSLDKAKQMKRRPCGICYK